MPHPPRVVLLTLFAVLSTCGDERSASDPDADVPSGDATASPEVDGVTPPISTIARIDLQAPARIALGEVVTLSATAFDAAGDPVTASLLWASSRGGALAVTPDGRATALAPGLQIVTAYDPGSAAQAMKVVEVVDPTPSPTGVVSVQIAPELAAARELRALGDWVEVGGATTAERPLDRNHLIVAVDAANDTPLLMALLAGAMGQAPAQGTLASARVDFDTTAEALVLMTAGLAIDSPSALIAMRRMLADEPLVDALAETLAALSAEGASWFDAPGSFADALDDAVRRAAELLAPYHARYVGATGPAGTQAMAFVASVTPPTQSGVTVSASACGQSGASPEAQALCDAIEASERHRFGVVSLENRHSRHVFAYLERSDGQGGTIGPIVLGSMTYLTGFWQTVLTVLDGGGLDAIGAPNTSSAHRLVPLPDGTTLYRLTTYGPGFDPSTIPPGFVSPSTFLLRSAGPWLLTACLDLGMNIVSPILNLVGLFGAKETATQAVVELAQAFLDGESLLVEAVKLALEGTNTKEALAAIIGIIYEHVVTKLASWAGAAGPNASAAVKSIGAGVAVAQLAWDVVSGLWNAVGTIWDFFVSTRGDLFTVRVDEGAILEPRDGLLREARLGCAYRGVIELPSFDPMQSYVWLWEVEVGVADHWRFVREGVVGEELWIERDGVIDLDDEATRFRIELRDMAGVTVAVQHFELVLADAPLVVEDLDVHAPGEPNVRAFGPGGAIEIEVVATQCGDPALVTDVDVRGVVSGALDWTQSRNAFWTILTLPSPLGDGPHDLIVEAAVAGTGARKSLHESVLVTNRPPTIPVQRLDIFPGRPNRIAVFVDDPNFAGGLPKEIPASSVVILDDGPPKTAPPLDLSTFVWDATGSDPARGRVRLVADGPIFLDPPVRDDDGVDGTGVGSSVRLRAHDDNGVAVEGALLIAVRNVRPVILNEDDRHSADDPPATFTLRVRDDNGVDDIGGPSLDGLEGLLVPAPPPTVDGDVVSFRYAVDGAAVRAACRDGCSGTFVVLDADDAPGNEGRSAPWTVSFERDCVDASDCGVDGATTSCEGRAHTTWECFVGTCVAADATDCRALGRACDPLAGCLPSCVGDPSCPAEGALACGGLSSVLSRTCDPVSELCVEVELERCLEEVARCHEGACVATCTPDDLSACDYGGAPFCRDGATSVRGVCEGGLCGRAETPCDPSACDPTSGACASPEASCDGRCGALDGQAPCQCDAACGLRGDCCGDLVEVCLVPCEEGLDCPDAARLTCSADASATMAVACDDGACTRVAYESCVDGLVCLAGRCEPAWCEDEGDCANAGRLTCDGPGTVTRVGCEGGRCVPLAWESCVEGSECVDGACVAAGCEASEACPGGGVGVCLDEVRLTRYECEDGACRAYETMCGAGLECHEGRCRRLCETTEDCPGAGQAICAIDCAALAVSNPGLPCPQATVVYACDEARGTCVETEPPSFCPQGQACVAGQCELQPECVTDGDCPYYGVPTCTSDTTLGHFTCDTDTGLCVDLSETCADGVCHEGVCVASTCAGACGEVGAACACDAECFSRGDCCEDVCQACPELDAPFFGECVIPCEGPADCPGGGESSCVEWQVDRLISVEFVCYDGQCAPELIGFCATGCSDGVCWSCAEDDDCPDTGGACSRPYCTAAHRCEETDRVVCDMPPPNHRSPGTCQPATGECVYEPCDGSCSPFGG